VSFPEIEIVHRGRLLPSVIAALAAQDRLAADAARYEQEPIGPQGRALVKLGDIRLMSRGSN